MKKRAAEAAVILIAVIIVFAVINSLSTGIGDSVRKIDGEYYNIGERELSLTLMTVSGTEQLGDFTRLERLKVSPYREAVKAAVKTDNAEAAQALRAEADEIYADCTGLEDISFVCLAPNLKELDVSLCGVSDISCLEGMELNVLNISRTNVNDISPLVSMDSLEELIITDIPVEDLSPLLRMKGLKKVTAEEGRAMPDGLDELGVTVVFEE